MKVTFTQDNNKTALVLPYVGEDSFSIEFGESKNEEYDSLKYGVVQALGSYGLTSVQFDVNLPIHQMDWMESEASYDPYDYIDFFDNAKQNRKPVRVVITHNDGGMMLNMLSAVDSLKIEPPRRNGEIPMSLTLVEYRKKG